MKLSEALKRGFIKEGDMINITFETRVVEIGDDLWIEVKMDRAKFSHVIVNDEFSDIEVINGRVYKTEDGDVDIEEEKNT